MKYLVLSLLFLTSCCENAKPGSNPIKDYNVTLLFINRGCSVYSFRKSGEYTHYYTDCNSISSTLPDGKHTRREEIQTSRGNK